MTFTRVQYCSHHIGKHVVDVRYDRFTTRFSLSVNQQLNYSGLVFIWPWRKQTVYINNTPYRLHICWFLLWHSSLQPIESSTTLQSIVELLPMRRRKSIILALYVGLISSIKITLGLLT